MFLHPFSAQRPAEQRTRDALREAERNPPGAGSDGPKRSARRLDIEGSLESHEVVKGAKVGLV